jgi:hypothetical protein
MPLPSAKYLWRQFSRALFNPRWKERAIASRKLGEAVTRFQNRKIYHDLTPEILKTISDDDLIQAICDCVEARLPTGPITVIPADLGLPGGCIAVYNYRRMDGDVWNGGFEQFLDSAGSTVTLQTIDGLRSLKLPALADLVAEAQRRFAARKSLRHCDNDYSNLHPTVEPHIVRFIREHPEQFVTGAKTG